MTLLGANLYESKKSRELRGRDKLGDKFVCIQKVLGGHKRSSFGVDFV